MGCHIAVGIGDGSGQDIGGILLAILIHIDLDRGAFVQDLDLNEAFGVLNFFAKGYRPSYGEHGLADTDSTVTGIVNGGQSAVVLILGLQPLHGIFCAGASHNSRCCGFHRLGSLGLGLDGRYFCRLTTCEQAHSKTEHKQPRKYFFHSKLLFIYRSFSIFI